MFALEKEFFSKGILEAKNVIELVGYQCSQLALKQFCPKVYYTYLFLIGVGNNGADGMSMARHLENFGHKILIWKIDQDDIVVLEELLQNHTGKALIIVDALFGIGFTQRSSHHDNNKYQFPLETIINKLNFWRKRYYKLKILSIDIPSGLNGSDFIQADYTYTIGHPKIECFSAYNRPKCGKIHIIGGGFPKSKALEPLPFKRNPYGHKNDFGHGLIIAGSLKYSGALRLCVKALVQTRVGLSSIATWNDFLPHCIGKLPPRAMAWSLEEILQDPKNILAKFQSLVIGPGLNGGQTNRSDKILLLVKICLENFSGPIILDADALKVLDFQNNELTKIFQSRFNANQFTLFTPHIGEFTQILGITKKEYDSDMEKYWRMLLENWPVHLIVKSCSTFYIQSNPYCSYVLDRPNSKLARGGSGDILSGILCGNLAQMHKNPTQYPLAVIKSLMEHSNGRYNE